jgi:hypothetical protein
MTSKNRSFRPSPAMIVACLALLLALTGSAIAAGIAKNSVRSAQIVDGTVRTVDIRDGAVDSAKVADEALTASDLGANSVATSEVSDQSLTANDLGPDSVGANEIATDAVGSIEISPDAVHADELGAIVQRTNATTVGAGKNGSITVNCAEGEQLLSGGGQPSVFGVEMTSTRPSGNGWLYQAKNTTGSDQTITAFALCLG